jgi:hypothetical protein
MRAIPLLRAAARLVAVAVIGALPAPARALDPPPADSLAATRARVGQTVELLETLGAAAELELGAHERLTDCRRLAAPTDGAGDARACADGLAAVHAELKRLRRETRDPLVRAAADRAATHASGTLSLLAWLDGEPGARPAEDPLLPHGRHPALVLVAEDDRSIAVEPLRTLRAGREYALVLEAPARLGEPAASPASAADERRLREDRFAGAAAGPPLEKVAAFVRALDALRDAEGGRAPFASVRLTLVGPIGSADLRSLRAYFVAATDAPSRGVVARFRTADPRAGLAAARAELRSEGCAPIPLRSGAASPPETLTGDVETLAPARTPAGSPGVASDPAALRVLLDLPTGLTEATPLVIALDGHQGSAARMLARHGAELTSLGLAVLSFDLPGHGARAGEGDFIVADDPARITRGIRGAAVDLIASVRAARVCGFALPGGSTYRPSSVRFLGYSLGAMVGSLARAVEADLGTSVFLAPGGDLFGWLMLRLGPALGGRFVACLGGPDHGETCIEDGLCAPPGRCIVDPFFQGLHETFEQPYRQATATADPLSFATRRTGAASDGRLLLITGGNDAVLHPNLATRLADAYDMRPVGPHRRRGPRSALVQWPHLGHDLHDRPEVRRQAHEFLASDGRRILPAAAEGEPETPGWYRVFGSARP